MNALHEIGAESVSAKPSGDLIIKAAEEADLAGILALYAQPDMDDGEVLTIEQARERLAQMRKIPGYELYIARCADVLVGSFALLMMPNLAHLGRSSGVLEDVVVDPAKQGQGVGRQMVAEALRLCRNHGCYKLVLSSNLRRARAHAFYRQLGFEQHGFSFRVDFD